MQGDSNFFYYIKDWLLDEPSIATLLGYDPNDATALRPVFPSQQFPESEFPYIRYTTMNHIAHNAPWMYTGEAFLFLWFNQIDDAQRCANIITEMCSYGDESAGELERWLAINDIQPPYFYHSIIVPGGGEIEPTSERGGAHSYALSLTVEYSPKQQRDRYAYVRNA